MRFDRLQAFDLLVENSPSSAQIIVRFLKENSNQQPIEREHENISQTRDGLREVDGELRIDQHWNHGSNLSEATRKLVKVQLGHHSG